MIWKRVCTPTWATEVDHRDSDISLTHYTGFQAKICKHTTPTNIIFYSVSLNEAGF